MSGATWGSGALWRGGALWRDGDPPPPAVGATLAQDRGLLLGDALFETLLVQRGHAPFLTPHLARLRGSAEALAFALPRAFEGTVEGAIEDLVAALPPADRMALRLTLTRGPGPRGLDVPADPHPTLLLRLAPAAPPPSGERAIIVDQPRVDPAHPLAGHKHTSRLELVWARRTARAAGGDLALLQSPAGGVVEADSANVFAVIDGVVVTPPLACGILPGITRAWVRDYCRAHGIPTAERPLSRDDLARATEVFLTSAIAGVRPLATIDQQRFSASPVAGGLMQSLEQYLASC